jgi:hypothetical protein
MDTFTDSAWHRMLKKPFRYVLAGLAWDKARPRVKRLSWQTQGWRVRSLAFLSILRGVLSMF